MNRFALSFVVAACVCVPQALAGPDWVEQGDAGSLVDTAQQTTGTGQINSISGTFSEGFGLSDYEDVYLITISNPGAFNISIGSGPGVPGLFIFDPTTQRGILGSMTGSIGSFSTDFTESFIGTPGVYAIGIAVNGRMPASDSGPIFSFASPGEISGPDGNGGSLPLIFWNGTPGTVGEYNFDLTGCSFSVPGPGVVGGLGVAGVLGLRRRR
ncbi:MAG: hypothetical protein U0640_13740 [Phycisphaerales bacterium]